MPDPRQQMMEPMPPSSALERTNTRQYDFVPDPRQQQMMEPMPSTSALASMNSRRYDSMPYPRQQQQQQVMEPVTSSRTYSSSHSMAQANWNDPVPVPSQRKMEPLSSSSGAYSSLPASEQRSWNTPQPNQYSVDQRSSFDLHPSTLPSSPTSQSTQLYDPSHRPRRQDMLPTSSDLAYSSTQPYASTSWSDQPHDDQSSQSLNQPHSYVGRAGPSGYPQRDNVVQQHQQHGLAQSAGERVRPACHKQASVDLLAPGQCLVRRG